MRIGVPKETRTGERLVAATPRTVAQLRDLGYDVVVERGAGEGAHHADAAYEAAGAEVSDADGVWASDVVTTVAPPSDERLTALTPGSTFVSMLAPASRPGLVTALAERGVTALALDAVPRISRAQALDVLSTLSNVAGYRAVIEAAEEYGGMFAGQVTAAGKTAPATVFVIGAGVAGLAAIGAAVSLGARVRAYDVRPEVAEQIESMGAEPVRAEAAQQDVSTDGYASALTAEQERLTAELYARECADADVVITTALVRGHAPRTITAAMVETMRPGSVVVDLAASGGGNCELTVPGERIVTPGGVVVLGWTDLPSRMARHTSQLVGTNIVHLMTLLTPQRDGVLRLDLEDPVQRGMTVSMGGEVLWPPPAVAVSASGAGPGSGPGSGPRSGPGSAPVVTPATPSVPAREQARATPAAAASDAGAPSSAVQHVTRRMTRRVVLGALAAVLVTLALTASPPELQSHVTVFVLAVVVGYYVISGVSHSLHTPLMAQTNAISGIILVGALLQVGSQSLLVSALAVVAASLASVNIFGGFVVAYRMIRMFRKEA